MTVESTTNRQESVGNGTTTVFPIPFYFLKNADIKVIQKVTSTGVETLKAITTDYTLTGEGDPNGGSLTMLVAPPTGTTLVIYRDTEVLQPEDFVDNDPNPAEMTERGYDRATLILQRHKELLARSIKVTDGTPSDFDPTLPAQLTPNKALIVSADGKKINLGETDVFDLTAATAALEAAAAAVAAANALFPIGASMEWPSFLTNPPGTDVTVMEEDGRSLLRSAFAELFAIIGTEHGAVDGTHFNLPRSADRITKTAGPQVLFYKSAQAIIDAGEGLSGNGAFTIDEVNGLPGSLVSQRLKTGDRVRVFFDSGLSAFNPLVSGDFYYLVINGSGKIGFATSRFGSAVTTNGTITITDADNDKLIFTFANDVWGDVDPGLGNFPSPPAYPAQSHKLPTNDASSFGSMNAIDNHPYGYVGADFNLPGFQTILKRKFIRVK